MRRTTTQMGQAHEAHIAQKLGARRSPGSGNQFNNQTDGRQSRYELDCAWAFDCKSTMGKSISVSLDMWDKLVEQSHGERPMMPLRFYATERLGVGLDLVVVTLDDFIEYGS